MKLNQLIILSITLCLCVRCIQQESKSNSTHEEASKIDDAIPVYNFDALEPLLYTERDQLYIINFWAMWCAPCVKELPYLQEFANNNPDIELVLISLDFPQDIESKLKPFLQKRNISAKVILLDDPDANTWIDKIDPNWSGSIPFTIVFDNKKRLFYERSFESLKDLENEIRSNFNK